MEKTYKPAFPVAHSADGINEGMTLRDYFAIRATEEEIKLYRGSKPFEGSTMNVPEFTREEARYRFADAMLKQREL